jgi:hypothetical protein
MVGFGNVLTYFTRTYAETSTSRKWAWGVSWEVARLGVDGAINFNDSIEIKTLNSLEGTNQKIGPFVKQIVLKQAEVKNEFSSWFITEIEAKVHIFYFIFKSTSA